MATVYLHIGTAKTATTALQRFFWSNRDRFEQHGIVYPDMGIDYPDINKNRNAHFLVGERLLGTKADGTPVHDTEREQKEYLQGMDYLAALAQRYDKILLSDESMWWHGSLWPSHWIKFKEGFSERNLSVKIIVYLRRQDLFIQSHWAQMVREGSPQDFQEYLASDFAKKYPVDYWQCLERIRQCFGRENIMVRPFEKQQFRGEEKNIYSDFLSLLGVKLSDGFQIKRFYQYMKLKGHYLELLRMLNHFEGMCRNPILTSVLRDVQGKKIFSEDLKAVTYFKSPAQQKEYLAAFEEGNTRIAREYLKREEGGLFLDKVKDLPRFEINNDILYKDSIMILGKCFDRMDRLYSQKMKAQDEKYEQKMKAQDEKIDLLARELRETRDSLQQRSFWSRFKK